MKPQLAELMKAETMREGFRFITETIQKGHIKPAKYVHSLKISMQLYEDLVAKRIINPEDYYLYETGFFEFRHDKVIISFVTRTNCDLLQFAIDRFIIKSLTGEYPVERVVQSKMNRDKKEVKPETLINQK
jgi:hypothetical protein